MRRRALLALTAAGVASIAGCGTRTDGSGDPSTDTPPTGNGSPTGTQPNGSVPADDSPPFSDGPRRVATLETGPRTVAVPDVGRPDDDLSADLAVAETATADHPMRLEISVTNRSEYREGVGQFEVPILYGNGFRSPHTDGGGRLYLVPTEESPFADDVPALTRGPSGYWRRSSLGPAIAEQTVVDAGETVTGTFRLVGGPDLDGLPPGRYGRPFEPQIVVWDSASPGPAGDSIFAGASPPPLAPDVDRTAGWYHAAGPDSATFVVPDRERATMPAGVGFTFHNHSTTRAQCGGWSLYKRHGDRWFLVAPYVQTAA